MQLLQIDKQMIVNETQTPVFLRGVCIGGWMNMEHFINGYPGSECNLRYKMAKRLGEEKAAYFFDTWLDYIFGEEDIKFLKSLGANVVRLPLNYRHFESDLAPYKYLEKGFKRLDTALNWCEKHGLYAILDLHSVQGWQNGDWHSDNSSRHALFWAHRQFQERFIALWEEFARRYKNHNAVAAYNLMNEPVSGSPFGKFGSHEQYQTNWEMLNKIYRETIQAIRKHDSKHIIFLEGDYFSTRFSGLDLVEDENTAYSSHNYIPATTKRKPYPGEMNGEWWDAQKINDQFIETEGYQFADKYQKPLWVGEFGVSINYPSTSMQYQIQAMEDQMKMFNAHGIHWTSWTYKDIGRMSIVQTNPDSAYIHAIQSVLEAKKRLRPDTGWLSGFPEPIEKPLQEIEERILSHIPGIDPLTHKMYFRQAAMSTYSADLLQELFVRSFEEMSYSKIDKILSSFALENCVIRKELTDRMSACFSE